MTKKNIYDLIDLETRIQYRTRVALAEKIGVTRSTLNNNLKKLELGENITLDVLLKMLDALNLEIIVQKKE